jgi:hypothetical protein
MTASSSWHCTKQKLGTDGYAAYFPATLYRNAIDMRALSDHVDWHKKVSEVWGKTLNAIYELQHGKNCLSRIE